MPNLTSLLLFIVFTCSLFGGEKTAPSEEMKSTLKDRLVGQHDLRLDGLNKLNWTGAKLEAFEKKEAVEIYSVPYPKGDYFGYTIYRIKADNRFLIIRSGGAGGLFEVYANLGE